MLAASQRASQQLGRELCKGATTATRHRAVRPAQQQPGQQQQQQRRRAATLLRRAATEGGVDAAAPAEPQEQQQDSEPEVVFYEGNAGSNVELALSMLLGATLVYLPLTMASIGRRLFVNFRITNKRLIVENTSPLFKRQTQIALSSEFHSSWKPDRRRGRAGKERDGTPSGAIGGLTT